MCNARLYPQVEIASRTDCEIANAKKYPAVLGSPRFPGKCGKIVGKVTNQIAGGELGAQQRSQSPSDQVRVGLWLVRPERRTIMMWQEAPPGPDDPRLQGDGGAARPGQAYFKTRLCTMFMETGACPYGDRCSFAHGEHELQRPPTHGYQRKTRPCNRFNTPEGCPYGDRCNFLHNDPAAPLALTFGGPSSESRQVCPPVREFPPNYKTRLCVRFEAGNCPFADKCHFAHGREELRDPSANREPPRLRPRSEGGRGPEGPGVSGSGATLNPPNAPVTFLFARRPLEPKTPELRAPAPAPDSTLAMAREANRGAARPEWADEGGSDVYGDRVES